MARTAHTYRIEPIRWRDDETRFALVADTTTVGQCAEHCERSSAPFYFRCDCRKTEVVLFPGHPTRDAAERALRRVTTLG